MCIRDRFQGGPNAGHTLEFDNIKHVLHQIPSGIFRSDIQNIIGNGVVLDPIVFRREIEGLQKFNLDLKANLYISKKASLILPTHSLLDAAYEKSKGDDKIGSTLRGIGPTYQDKVARLGPVSYTHLIEFLDEFRSNLFTEEVFCFTPRGELKVLPQGATALDFAFDIHSEVGAHCMAAKVCLLYTSRCV